jgi:hypothetical protein
MTSKPILNKPAKVSSLRLRRLKKLLEQGGRITAIRFKGKHAHLNKNT